MGRVEPGLSVFGSRGIGNYIHLDFQNYLDYGARRRPPKGSNITRQEGAEVNFRKINDELKSAINQRMKNINKKNKNADQILESYLNGIFYPRNLDYNAYKNTDFALASKAVYDGVDNVLNRLIYSGAGNYESLKTVVQNGAVRELFEGYLNQNESYKRLKAMGADRKRIYEHTLERIFNTLKDNLSILRNNSLQSATIHRTVLRMEQIEKELDNMIKEILSTGEGKEFDTGKSGERFFRFQEVGKNKTGEFKGQKLLQKLIEAINLISAVEKYNPEVYGDVGERMISSGLNLIENAFGEIQVNANRAAKNIVGKNTANFNSNNNTMIELSSFLKNENFIGAEKMSASHWGQTTSKSGQVIIESKRNSQGTIDVMANIQGNALGLDKKMGVNQLTASIKNYYNISDISLLGGAPLLSILSIGGIDVSNHYLNFVSGVNRKETSIINVHSFKNVLKMLLAVRSLLGVKTDLKTGSSNIVLNEYLIVNSKQRKKIYVIDTKDFINRVYHDLNNGKGQYFMTTPLDLEINLSSSNTREGGENAPPSYNLAKQRIAKILIAASAVKLGASVNLEQYLNINPLV